MAQQIAAKNIRSIKCQEDECQLKPQHFALYSSIKRAIDSDFDLNGKDLVPLLRSVEVLRRRFSNHKSDDWVKLNGSSMVLSLLDDEKLNSAIKTLQTDDGRTLMNLYRSSSNGRSQNLACSEWRVNEIEFAAKKLERNEQLALVFSKIHKNFAKKSAKKCLKHSCNSLDESMSRIDSVLRRPTKSVSTNEEEGDKSDDSDGVLNDQAKLVDERDFDSEELELCHFFKRTKGSSCQISGRELSEISFLNEKVNDTKASSSFGGPLKDYKTGKWNSTVSGSEPASNSNHTLSQLPFEEAQSKIALSKCHSIKPLLAYNLAGLRWYTKRDLIEPRKLVSRTFWCPSLSYWLELDRLCGELESALKDSVGSSVTFFY